MINSPLSLGAGKACSTQSGAATLSTRGAAATPVAASCMTSRPGHAWCPRTAGMLLRTLLHGYTVVPGYYYTIIRCHYTNILPALSWYHFVVLLGYFTLILQGYMRSIGRFRDCRVLCCKLSRLAECDACLLPGPPPRITNEHKR